MIRLDSYAISLSLLALSRHVPPGPGVLPLSRRHRVAPGVEDKGSRGDPAPEHLGEESRRETSLETSVEGLVVAGDILRGGGSVRPIRAERDVCPGRGKREFRPRHGSMSPLLGTSLT